MAERWYEIVGSEDMRHRFAGTRIERIRDPRKAAGYMGHYARKLEQKIVPEEYRSVGRFWGGTRLKRVSFMRYTMDYRMAARELRTVRRWYKVRCAKMGHRWKWGGFGFCLQDGARLPIRAFPRQVREEDV